MRRGGGGGLVAKTKTGGVFLNSRRLVLLALGLSARFRASSEVWLPAAPRFAFLRSIPGCLPGSVLAFGHEPLQFAFVLGQDYFPVIDSRPVGRPFSERRQLFRRLVPAL